ncbi:Adaptin ear-binding coat-associated protein 1 NECAP-1 [Lasiodiplodia theobromae]|uniref:Adaptin ear-binding coat-associated protein 1 n=1 Tax=Lasiodiplodia theobromae TaxID=45133 RepID=A0A5N5D7X9_9PEZI|nr:Adaptin ear-binding coat-associated protein 2 [Lasiodiplodia theobromae]KAB2573685.1 Adaptin ear-binding coat-associated protein 1 [Lasiodiplodia theobromae]KAF4535775.1 Adaptin ear-binding coat-associated protein 2 [Lasiodiplodia theobromae]KAF9628912.1 Adaptin ear-binding coat-associated protein 1 NECAP-1 [Lasiodiplodia theobromae]
METIDPTTGQKLPPDAIQRVLFIATNVHIYQIPPLSSNKGYSAAEWTDEKRSKKIFTGRMRLLETAVPKSASTTTTTPEQPSEDVKVDLLVEDPATGELFAAAPYTSPAVVEQAIDSSRFFAVQFRNQGMKATLGIGFEERSEAMDFNISLQDARKVLGFEPKGGNSNGSSSGSARPSSKSAAEEKKDFSLKEGETITVNIGGRGRRNRNSSGSPPGEENKDAQAALFSIKPPPASGGGGGPVPFLPPPPSASSVKAERRRSRPLPPQGAMPPAEKQPSPQELGFDDGEFGEFQ